MQSRLEDGREKAQLERIYAGAFGLGGVVLGLASAGGFGFWQWRRTRRTSRSAIGVVGTSCA